MQYLYYPIVGAFYAFRFLFYCLDLVLAVVTDLLAVACEFGEKEDVQAFFKETPAKLKEYFNAAPSEDN